MFRFVAVVVFILVSLMLYQHSLSASQSVQKPQYTRVETQTDTGVKVEFIDNDGNLVTPFGNYSTVYKALDSAGRIVQESFYYGDERTTSSMGQYGNIYEYDESGNPIETTYVDANGEPMNALLGYSTVRKSFYDDGRVKDEMYYDTEGNPVKQSAGNYGIRHINKTILYLDKDGKAMFNLNLFLSHHQWVVTIVGFMLCGVIVLLKRKYTFGFLFAVIGFILFLTLIRSTESGGLKLELFWSYKQFFTNYNLRVEILNNIWLFIPLGAGIRSIFRKPRYLILPFLLSVSIEATQYCFHLGLCELDDVFSNTLGACVGFLMAYDIEEIIGWLRMKRKKKPEL